MYEKRFLWIRWFISPNLSINCEWVPPAGIEPAHQPPEGCALSPELRGRMCKVISACMNAWQMREFRYERTHCIFCHWMFLGCRKTFLEIRWCCSNKRWLHGRNDCKSFIWISVHRIYWTHRNSPGDLRSEQDFIFTIAQRVLGNARSDDIRSPR